MNQFNKRFTILTAAAVVAVLGLMSVFFFAPKVQRHVQSNGEEEAAFTPGTAVTEQQLDQIKPLDEDTISILGVGVDKSEKLTDVIMYAVLNTKDQSVKVLRIPRDTFVGSDYPTGKINALYGHPDEGKDGIETLRDYLEENWGLEIDYYASITLDGVRSIVDDMGGVTMNIDRTIDYLPGKILYPGEQVLNGEQAEWILRYRSGYQNGDLGRIDMQGKFLSACLQTAKDVGRLKCVSVLMKNYSAIDTDLSLDKMISIATSFFTMDPESIVMETVPGQGGMYYSYAVYEVDREGLVEMLNESFVDSGTTLMPEELNIPQLGGSQGGYQSSSQQSQESPQYDDQGNLLFGYDQEGNPVYLSGYDEAGQPIYRYGTPEENPDPSQQPPAQENDPEEGEMPQEGSQQEEGSAGEEDQPGVIRRKPKEEAQEEQGGVIRKKDSQQVDEQGDEQKRITSENYTKKSDQPENASQQASVPQRSEESTTTEQQGVE